MSKRIVFLVSALMVLCLGTGVSADITSWTNNGATDLWNVSGNWSGSVPGGGDIAFISTASPNDGPTITTDIAANPGNILGPDSEPGERHVVDINGSGTLITVEGWKARFKDQPAGETVINIGDTASVTLHAYHEDEGLRLLDTGLSYLNISGSPTINIVGADLEGADVEGGMFYVNMSGGTVSCADFIIGDNGGGELNVSGGLFRSNQVTLGRGRGVYPIDVSVTGTGEIRVWGQPPDQMSEPPGAFELPSSYSRAGVVQVKLDDNGILRCQNLLHGSWKEGYFMGPVEEWNLDIQGAGQLILEGDVKSEIEENDANGQITAYEGDGTVKVNVVGPNTVVTGVAPNPLRATKGRPPTRSTFVDPCTALSWTEGAGGGGLVKNHIYLGTSWTDVNNASTSVYEGNTVAGLNDWDPCNPPLELDTKYYWRVDEEYPGPTFVAGKEWEFTTWTEQVDPNLLVWYEFDEESGFSVADYSGNQFTGYIDIKYKDSSVNWLPEGGKFKGALDFEHPDMADQENTVVQLPIYPDCPFNYIDDEITISVWLKDVQAISEDNPVFVAGLDGDDGEFVIRAYVPKLGPPKIVQFRAGDVDHDQLNYNFNAEQLNGWHLWTFIKDEGAVPDPYMSIYLDGELKESKIGVYDTLEEFTDACDPLGFGAPMRVGGTIHDNYDYHGQMDRFKLVNRAWTTTDVLKEYRGGELAKAWDPDPPDGDTGTLRDTDLTWKRGSYERDGHDVYFGTNFNEVNDANTNDTVCRSPKQGANEVPNATLEGWLGAPLALDTQYYWRIDEHNDVNIATPWKGDTWTFKTATFLVVDDMESYDDDDPPITRGINAVWIDGTGDNSSSSDVELWFPADEYVRTEDYGDHSMEYYFNTTQPALNYYAEASAETRGDNTGDPNLELWGPAGSGGGTDFTQAGVKALTLYFRGKTDNPDDERMYIALEDTDGNKHEVDYPTPANLKKTDWQEWNISLNDFIVGSNTVDPDPNEVNVTDVNVVYLGFGTKGGPAGSGNGYVYFDDIRLSLPRCVYGKGHPNLDFDRDCRVYYDEVRMLAGEWLKSDVSLVGGTTAPAVAPVLIYDFNSETSGSTIVDSAGAIGGPYNGLYTEDSDLEPNDVDEQIDKKDGWDSNSLKLTNSMVISIPNDLFVEQLISGQNEVTISLWVRNDDPAKMNFAVGSTMFDIREWDGSSALGGNRILAVDATDEKTFILKDDTESVGYTDEYDWYYRTGWEHYAFVRNDSNLVIYLNGQEVANGPCSGNVMAVPGLLYLGASAEITPAYPTQEDFQEGWGCNIDEFKIYKQAITAANARYIADGDGKTGKTMNGIYEMDSWLHVHEGIVKLYDSEAKGSRGINFRDYAILADAWLDQVLWPNF